MRLFYISPFHQAREEAIQSKNVHAEKDFSLKIACMKNIFLRLLTIKFERTLSSMKGDNEKKILQLTIFFAIF